MALTLDELIQPPEFDELYILGRMIAGSPTVQCLCGDEGDCDATFAKVVHFLGMDCSCEICGVAAVLRPADSSEELNGSCCEIENRDGRLVIEMYVTIPEQLRGKSPTKQTHAVWYARNVCERMREEIAQQCLGLTCPDEITGNCVLSISRFDTIGPLQRGYMNPKSETEEDLLLCEITVSHGLV